MPDVSKSEKPYTGPGTRTGSPGNYVYDYSNTDGGSDVSRHLKDLPHMPLYLAVPKELHKSSSISDSLTLYLDLEKANAHREPAFGRFMSGKMDKTQSGGNTHDLTDLVLELMDEIPGEDLKKDKDKNNE